MYKRQLLNDKIINYLEIQINNLEKNYFEVKSILLDSFAIQDKTNKYVDSTIASQNESLKDISIRLESISTKLDTISISYSSKLIMLERLINENYEKNLIKQSSLLPVSYTHLRAHETRHDLVCRLLLEKKKQKTH